MWRCGKVITQCSYIAFQQKLRQQWSENEKIQNGVFLRLREFKMTTENRSLVRNPKPLKKIIGKYNKNLVLELVILKG